MKKRITISLNDKKSLKNAIDELERMKKVAKQINDEFLKRCLVWIKERADFYLDRRVGKYKGTAEISKSWIIEKVDKNRWRLRNVNPVGAYVEFGTGLIGEQNPHGKANELGYEYDVNNHGSKGWNWENEELGISMFGFKGYEGKSFLYDAFLDFTIFGKYKEIYQELIKEKTGLK